jgi:hypothetical protein
MHEIGKIFEGGPREGWIPCAAGSRFVGRPRRGWIPCAAVSKCRTENLLIMHGIRQSLNVGQAGEPKGDPSHIWQVRERGQDRLGQIQTMKEGSAMMEPL